MEKGDTNVGKEKKKFNLKEIGKKNLVLLFLAGILLAIAFVPEFLAKEEPYESEESGLSTAMTDKVLESTPVSENETYTEHYENKLKKLLEKMDGIGKVEVMITLKSSKERIVLKDNPYTQESLNEADNEGGSRVSSSVQSDEETVLISNQTGESVPYVTKEVEAQIEGVVVIAQGGGDGQIATDIVKAVEVLFNVPVHKIKVLKMKE